MEHIDMILKLRDKAGITYDEARDVLERSGWDMLDALALLEREGKIKPLTSSLTTAESGTQYEEVKATASGGGSEFGEKIKKLFIMLMTYHFIVRRGGREIISIPGLIAIIIACWMIWPVVVGLIIGFFLGCNYTVEKK